MLLLKNDTKRLVLFFVLSFLFFLPKNYLLAQGSEYSTKGVNFWLTFGQIGWTEDPNGKPEGYPYPYSEAWLGIRVAATERTEVTLSFTENSNLNTSFIVEAGEIGSYSFSDAERLALYQSRPYATGTNIPEYNNSNNKSLSITTDKPVSAYAVCHNSGSGDATNLLPIQALGTSYRHISYKAWSAEPNYQYARFDGYAVIATTNGTVVEVNGTVKATLNKGGVYYAYTQSDGEYTGSFVTTSAPAAYFVMNTASRIPQGVNASENLFQQMSPINMWGRNFVVPVSVRGKERLRIMASLSGTSVTIQGSYTVKYRPPGTSVSGNTISNIVAGMYVEVEITSGCYINATFPVGIASFFVGSGAISSETIPIAGDPSLAWIPSLEQVIPSVTIAPFQMVVDNQGTMVHYAVIVAPTDATSQTTVQVGTGAPTSLSGGTWINVPSSLYSYYNLPLDVDNVYTFNNPNGLTTLAYGYGISKSYYYMAGAAVRNLNPHLRVDDNHYQDVLGKHYCDNDIDFQAVVYSRYGLTGYLTWYVDNVPQPQLSDVTAWNFSTLTLPPGAHIIRMEVRDINGDVNICTYDFTVIPPLTINGLSSVCLNRTIQLTPSSPGGTWESSNTNIATVNSMGVVTGIATGTTVITYRYDEECSTTKTITVNALPSPTISANPSACIGDAKTYMTEPSKNNYIWTIGGIENIDYTKVGGGTTSRSVTVTWLRAGTKSVSVNYTDANGCSANTPAITYTSVRNSPVVSISDTEICIGTTATLSPSSGTWVSNAPAVATVAGNVVTGIAPGTVTFTCTDASGCSATTTTLIVASLPAAPTLKDGANTNVCEGETIDATLLESLLDYNRATLTVAFYTDAACTMPFTAVTANYASSPYTIYAVARNTAAECTTPAASALILSISVDQRPDAPTLKDGADTSVCEGETIDVVLLESLLDYNEATQTVAFYINAACTIPFTAVTANHAASPYTIYAVVRNTATGCTTPAASALALSIRVDQRPDAPALKDDNDISVCEGEIIDNNLLESLLDYDETTLTVEFYTDDACTIPFTNVIADYVTNYYIIYAVARNTATGCVTDASSALLFIIWVDLRPDAPTLKDGADTSVCEDATIDASFLESLLDYNRATLTVAFYTDAACTIPFTAVTANYANSPYTIYAVARNTVAGCATSAASALALSISVDQRPITPTLKDGADTSVCEGETIDVALLEGLLEYNEATQTIAFYTNAACTTPFTAVTANHADSPYIIYVIARNTITGCTTPAASAFVLSIKADQRPAAPTLKDNADTSVCEDTTIDATFLESLLNYDETTLTIDFYTDAACTAPFVAVTADYASTPYTIYAVAHNTATGCTTPAASAMVLSISVDQRPAAPTLKDNADTSVCEGTTIDATFLESLLNYNETTLSIDFYTDAACTAPFVTVTADYANTPYIIYAVAHNTATGCTTPATSALVLSISVDQHPAAPTLKDNADTSVCEGTTIDAAFLESLIDYNETTLTVAFYTDAACTIPFTAVTANYASTPYIIYAVAHNTVTGCTTPAASALVLSISVDQRPAAPTLKDGADTSVCEGETIDATFLESLLNYDETTLTIDFYTDAACTAPFVAITADYASTPYIIYAVAHNTATECATPAASALVLSISVDQRPAAPTLKDDADTSVCEGTTIDAPFLESLIDYNETTLTIDFYTDAACTAPFVTVTADYASTPYIIYAVAHNTVTGCTTPVASALMLSINVDQRPAAPTLKDNADTSVCEGTTIDAPFLESLLNYDETTLTIDFYTDAACTAPFVSVTADYASTPYIIYAVAHNTATGCTTSAASALVLSISVDQRPAAPTLKDDADTSVCEGTTIDAAFLESLIDYNETTLTVAFYINAACTIPFTAVTANYADTPYIIYAVTHNTVTGCTTPATSALVLSISVDQRPAAPTLKDGADTSVCEGETIDASFLESLLDYDETTLTIDFYTDAACTAPFVTVTADYADTPYIIYAVARNAATGCTTPAASALVLSITVDRLPDAPEGSLAASTCDGGAINLSLALNAPPANITYNYYSRTIQQGTPVDVVVPDATAAPYDADATYWVESENTTTGCKSIKVPIQVSNIISPSFVKCPAGYFVEANTGEDFAEVDYMGDVEAAGTLPVLSYAYLNTAGDTLSMANAYGEGLGYPGFRFPMGVTTVVIVAKNACNASGAKCRFNITVADATYTLAGTVFPFVRETDDEFTAMFPVTASLYAVPSAGSKDPVGDILASEPIHTTTAEDYDGSRFVPGTPKNPGDLGMYNNPGNFIDWEGYIGKIPGPIDQTELTEEDNIPTAPIGLFTFTGVLPGDYILILSRPGCLTRLAKITVTDKDEALGHRELITGDVDDNRSINYYDLQKQAARLYEYPHLRYNAAFDLDGSGKVDADDMSLLQAYLNVEIDIYQETKEWLREYYGL